MFHVPTLVNQNNLRERWNKTYKVQAHIVIMSQQTMITVFSCYANFRMLPPQFLYLTHWEWQPSTDPCLGGTALKIPTWTASSCSPSLYLIPVHVCAIPSGLNLSMDGPLVCFMRQFLLVWESFNLSFWDLSERSGRGRHQWLGWGITVLPAGMSPKQNLGRS